MTRLLVILLFLLPLAFGFATPATGSGCDCPVPANFHKSGQGTGSITLAWDASQGADRYELWFTRTTDNFTSETVYAAGSNYTFTGLSAGSHTFYIRAVCGEETSNIIGVVDIIQ